MTQTDHRPQLSLIIDGTTGPGARHGLAKLRQALRTAEFNFEEAASLDLASAETRLVTGLAASGEIRRLAEADGAELPTATEGLCVQRLRSRPDTWLVAGADDRGLMYALLDVAERVSWAAGSGAPLGLLRETAEAPEVVERSLSIYTMHRATFESRFHDTEHWARYLDMLAQNRFNTLALLFAYESAGYYAPPYPYFFGVPGYPEVHVAGVTPAMQAQALSSLNRLIAMAHERAIDVTLGIWDHIYRGGVQTGGVEDKGDTAPKWRVQGVTQDNLMDYSIAAFSELLTRVPNLDAVQFRMHGESGLSRGEMDVFWDRIYDVIVAQAPYLRFDARAKGFPDHLIDLALEKGVRMRICTKYWMEQMGLPFHPTHIHPANQHDRRHGYADLLRYPQRYKLHWRLWNGGTSRVLLWGDPDYVQRFVESTHLYGGEGFDVNEPVATKMLAQDHDAPTLDLLTKPYRDYDFEFERYWHFYQLWGRLGYSPTTTTEVWQREFARRFGAAGPSIAAGLHAASRILPRIVAYTYPYELFPTTRGWVEKECMGDLPTYASALPSDTEQFLSITDEAENRLAGRATARIRPQASAAWFDRVADDVLGQVAIAEQVAGHPHTPEFVATIADLRILAHLAQFHSRRAHAGAALALFDRSGDLNALDEAIDFERQAITAWGRLVEAAGDVYADDLAMGLPSAGLAGHWRDELGVLQQSLADLEARRTAYPGLDDAGTPWLAHVPVRRRHPGEPIRITATARGDAPVSMRLCYGAADQEVICAPMTHQEGLPPKEMRWHATIPGYAVEPGLWYLIEMSDRTKRRRVFPSEGEGHRIDVDVSSDDAPPEVVHTPVTTAPIGRAIVIEAEVRDPSGVRWVHLRYRPVNQFEDYRMLPMVTNGEQALYRATIPADEVTPEWDLMYFIESMDNHGNGAIWPDLEVETPYVVITLDRS